MPASDKPTPRAPSAFASTSRGLVLFAALLACACAPEASSDDDGEDSVAAIIKPRSFVVKATPGEDVKVEADQLVFRSAGHDDLLQRQRGDVLVCGEGDGFLRRVRSVQAKGSEIVVKTEAASLTDAVEQGRVRQRVTPEGGVAPKGRLPGAPVSVSVPAFELPVPGLGYIEVQGGAFDLDPQLDFDFLVKKGRVEKAKIIVGGAAHTALRARFDLDYPPTPEGVIIRKGEPDKPIAALPPIRTLVWIGSIPVVVTVRTELIFHYGVKYGAHVKGDVDYEQTSQVRGGVELEGGAWRSIGEASFRQEPKGKVVLSSYALGGDLTLTAKTSVSLYESASVFVALEGYVGIANERESGSHAEWVAEAGVRGFVGAEAKVFGEHVLGYQAMPFDKVVKIPLSDGR